MWVSEGRILETDRLATNSMHHQGVRTVAPMLDSVAYGSDGLVEAVEVRDRSFIMGVQWHPEFFAGTREMGCLFASLAQEAIRSHTVTFGSMRVGVAVSISRRLPTQGHGRQWNMPMVFKRCSHIFRM